MRLIETIVPLEKQRDHHLAVAGQMTALINKLQDMCPHRETRRIGDTHGATLEKCTDCNKLIRL